MNDGLTLWTGNDQLQLTFGSPSVMAGLGVHVLRLELSHQALWLDPEDHAATAVVLLGGTARLDPDNRLVGAFAPRTLGAYGFPVGGDWLELQLSDEQLVALDIARGPGDFALRIDVTATVISGQGGHRAPYTAQLSYRIPAPLWHQILDAAGAEVGVTVRVPSPLTQATVTEGEPEPDGGVSTAGLAKRFREAKGHLREGRYEDCVTSCRKILEALKGDEKDTDVRPHDRNQVQRWVEIRKAATALANAAPHEDAVTRQMTWTRRDAEPLLAITAALLTQARR